MADSDFSVYARIQADTSNFEKGMKQAQISASNLSNTFNNVSKIITKALSFAGLAVGTKAIVDFGKSCVQSANQAVKTFNILDNTVKATGADAWTSIESLESASKSLSDQTNYSVTEIQQMQSVLLGFTNITGEAFDGASEAVLDMATVMGMDLTSAVQTVGKALDDPITGLDSLSRQGFKFTDEQKAELAQLVRNGKQLEAQKIILDTLSTSYGGAAKAGQDSFAKQRHAVENFSDALGGKLIPLMKSFAIDNANMINSLRESLEQIDFNEIGAVIKVTFDEIKKRIQNSFEYIKKIFSETKSLLKNIDFSPIVSIIDNLVLAFEKIGKINLNRITNIFKDLKDSFSGFSENIDLTKFSEVINLMINGFVFLYDEANKVFDTLLDNIKTFITNTWNSIKSIFEAGNKALADSETDIKSWGDFFYNQFNNVFKIAQDMIQSVSAILKGDWKVAWEYAKLTVLRIVDGLLDAISTLLNAFPDMVNKFIAEWNKFLGFINKGRKKLGMEEIELVPEFKHVDLSGITGVQDKIEEVEKTISNLTGAKADKNLKDLDKFVAGSSGLLGEFVDNFKEATDKAKKELDNLSGEYKATTGSMKDDGKSTYKAYSEWDSKLLQQRLENLGEWSDEYHEINIQFIEQERKKALENGKNEEERAKINEYYNNEIEEENERFEEAKRNKAKETMKIIISTLSNIAKNAVNVFKNVLSTIGNVFNSIVSAVKSAFTSIFTMIKNIVSFSIDDALDSLLEFEDGILTFFLETLPKLPQFLASAFQSVSTLLSSLDSMINYEELEKTVNSIIELLTDNLPKAFSSAVNIFKKTLTAIGKSIQENAPEIVNAFGEMFLTVMEALPGIIDTLFSTVGELLSNLGKYLTENKERFETALKNIVTTIINSISDFIKNGGWKNLLNGILAIQQAIENAVADNIEDIGETIVSLLPDLMEFLKKSIISASKTLGKIAPTLMKIIVEIIASIIEIALDSEVIESSFDAIEGILKGAIPAIIDLIVKVIPLVIKALMDAPRLFLELVTAIIGGIIEGFMEVDWLQVIKDIFSGFVDAFKDFFGIHSPSTLFEGFGLNIIEGFNLGLQGFADAVKTILEPIFDFIDKGMGKTLDFMDDLLNPTESLTAMFNGLETLLDSIPTLMKVSAKVTITTLAAIVKAVTDVHNTLRDIIKSVTTIKVWTPWETYKIGGVDIGTVKSPDISSYLNLVDKLATGTNNARKGLTLVGEAGPELVNFRGGEQVYNNHNTEKMLANAGGTTINQNVVFNNLQDTTAFAMMQQLKAYNRQMAINSVI